VTLRRVAAVQAALLFGPDGALLAGSSFSGPDILVTDIDIDALDGAYLDLDVIGHYARPDLFRLDVSSPPASRSPR
jgi:nitrilase